VRILFVLLLLAVPAWAGVPLDGLEWVQRQGALLPMDAPLRESDGQGTTLRRVAGAFPLVLAPGYFHCPNLCGTVRDDLDAALAQSGLQAGRDYALAFLGVHPAVGPEEAAAAHVPDGHRLTGSAASTGAIADAAGFRFRFDPALRQILHPSGVAVVSPSGQVSGYVLGVGYDPGALRDAVRLAAAGGQAAANPVLLLCFHFNAATGRYTLAVEKLLRIAAVLTALSIGGTLWLAHRPSGAVNRTTRESLVGRLVLTLAGRKRQGRTTRPPS